MSTAPLEIGPGDVLTVLGSAGFFSRGIQWFERIAGKDAPIDHCVVVTHQDAKGRWVGISGQPGGVGLATDCTRYLTDKRSRVNHAQPRPNDDQQLTKFLAACAKALKVDYDWVGIAIDAAIDLNTAVDALVPDFIIEDLERIWAWPTKGNVQPAHFVCSNLAAWLYESVGWARPCVGTERLCQPADWWNWSDSQGWLA